MTTAEVTLEPHDLTVVFADGKTEEFVRVESSWIDNGVLRLRCRDAGRTNLYMLPLVGIRLWHRELT
jgi:hypothetical protein